MQPDVSRTLVWLLLCLPLAGIALQGGMTEHVAGGLMLVALAITVVRTGRRSAAAANARS